MPIEYKGIDHIQLAAPPGCEQPARKFYGQLLELEEIDKPKDLQKRGGCWFKFGGQELHIGVQPDFISASKAHPGLLVTGLEHLRQKLLKVGCQVKEDSPNKEECGFIQKIHSETGSSFWRSSIKKTRKMLFPAAILLHERQGSGDPALQIPCRPLLHPNRRHRSRSHHGVSLHTPWFLQ